MILFWKLWKQNLDPKYRPLQSDTGFHVRFKFELWSFTLTSYGNKIYWHDPNFESLFSLHSSTLKKIYIWDHLADVMTKNNSSWSETDDPIRWRPILGPFLPEAMLRRGRRFNHFPHHLDICIFSTRLHVFVKSEKSISVSCM